MARTKRRKRPAAASRGASVQTLNTTRNKPLSTGAQAAALVADVAFRRRVQRFWPLGDRVLAELLAQLAVHHDCRDEVEHFLVRAAELDDVIPRLGGDRWPTLPLRVVKQ
jgi:hypothetical protein